MHQFASLFRINNMTHSQNNLPPDLLNKVMSAINNERARLVVIRNLVIASLAGVGAIFSSIFAWISLSREFTASGFGRYFSLVFSDIKIVLPNWQDFSLSLLESFPATNAAVFIAVIVILMVSVKFIVIYGAKISAYRHFKPLIRA